MKTGRVLVAAVGLSFVALAAAQQTIDYAKGINFSKYKSYNWTQGTPAVNPTIENSIRDAVDRELQVKGLTRRSENPDLYVATHASKAKEKLENWPSAIPVTIDWVGTLVVDLTDVNSKKVVWRGVVQKILAEKTQNVPKQVNKEVKKLFRDFPPKSKN